MRRVTAQPPKSHVKPGLEDWSTFFSLFLLSLAVVVTTSLISIGLILPHQIKAQSGGVAPGETVQTNPKTRQNQVTATVPDNAPPTAPILISPSNGALVTTSKPSFVWQASTDEQGISNYQMFLDGISLYGYIPTTSTTNSDFTLVYDNINDEYTLSPTANIPDGTHTWKIVVYDNTGNTNVSATWQFTIDTQAPSFVLTQIGTAAVNISAQDISTIPVAPIELTANEPLLTGTGEANSTVQTTLVIPGEPTQNYTTTITAGGNFDLQLGILPRGVVMTLNFLITDLAGNISVLNGVEFFIRQETIIIPPASPSPSPTPGAPSASPLPPSESPLPPTPGVSPPPSPIIEIPITPPREIILRGTQRLARNLPEEALHFLESIPPEITAIAQEIAPISAVMLASIVPIVSTIAVATQFGGQLSLNLLLRILQTLGLLPAGKPQGLVFDTDRGEGVPFAILTVTTTDTSQVRLSETVITNPEGVYQGLKLPAGQYTITVAVQDYLFPTKLTRPPHLRISDFYKGEVFSLREHESPTLLIPVDPLSNRERRPFNVRLRVFLARLSHYAAFLLLPLFVVSLILALVFPSIWNWAIVGIYLILILWKLIKMYQRPIITGTVVTDDGQPCQNAILRIRELKSNQVAGISLTDKWGRFTFYGEPAFYEIACQKQGYVWVQNQAPLSSQQLDTRSGQEQIIITLSSLSKIYHELGLKPF